MFCEVKGPRDKLSDKQRLWIDIILSGGGRVEVCHISENGYEEEGDEEEKEGDEDEISRKNREKTDRQKKKHKKKRRVQFEDDDIMMGAVLTPQEKKNAKT